MSPRRHEPLFPGFDDPDFGAAEVISMLIDRRLSLGLTQTEVAARMGTSQSSVARLEAMGDDNMMISTLRRYAAALGTRLDIIIK